MLTRGVGPRRFVLIAAESTRSPSESSSVHAPDHYTGDLLGRPHGWHEALDVIVRGDAAEYQYLKVIATRGGKIRSQP
jgi:hypothetical protein